MNPFEEKELFEKIKNGNEKAFEILFHRYYCHLCAYASKILNDSISAEEIVQDFFVKLWEKRTVLSIETSIANYFFRSIKNLCINQIKHDKIKQEYSNKVMLQSEKNFVHDNYFTEIDLAEKIDASINSLPKKRREIFKLSREDGLKYREIAEKLNISIKTVETQMGLAIKTLHDKLKNYTALILLFFTFK